MKPVLYDKSASSFTSNGKGTLDFISCQITEERNGIFELEAEISESAYHASEIEMNSFIKAKVPDQSDDQLFRVYKITKPLKGIYKIQAQHKTYQLSFIPSMPFSVTASSSACSQALAGLKTNAAESCPFNFSTDVTTVAAFGIGQPTSIRSALGGIQGSVLDRFGGELKWNNDNVSLLRNRGTIDPEVTLRYGKDIIDINQEENISQTITGVVPFWEDSDGANLVTLPEKVVDSQYASAYPFKRTVVLDCSQDFEQQPTQAALRDHAQAYVNANGVGIPKVSIKVSFINLKTEIANSLQEVKLCDRIGVVFEKLGINTTAQVVKYIYDVLKERYVSIEVGTIKQTLASTISGNMEDIEGVESLTKDMIKKSTTALEGDISGALSDAKDYADGAASTAQSNAESYADGAAGTAETNAKTYTDNAVANLPTSQQVAQAIDNATAWLTGSNGYVMAVKDNNGKWAELIFADHNDPQQWHNVLRINENGIGFSSDGGAHYTQAWTLDGKLVIGGTDVPSLTVYDNQNPPNIIFQTSRAGTIWNSTNSSMTAAGLLTAVGAILTGATIQSGTTGTNTQVNIADGEISFGANDEAYLKYTTTQVRDGSHTYNIDNLDIYSEDSIFMQNNHNAKLWLLHNEYTNDTEVTLANNNSVMRIDENGVYIYGYYSSSRKSSLNLSNEANLSSDGNVYLNGDVIELFGSGEIYIHNNSYDNIELYTPHGQILLNQNNPLCGLSQITSQSWYDVSDCDVVINIWCDTADWYIGLNYILCSIPG